MRTEGNFTIAQIRCVDMGHIMSVRFYTSEEVEF